MSVFISYARKDADAVALLRTELENLLLVPPVPDLPNPLPDAPPLPRSYGDEFRRSLAADSLTRDEQIQLTAVLKAHSDDPLHGSDALELLHRLRARPDVMFEIAVGIDAFLGERPSDGALIGSDDETSAEQPGVPIERVMTEFRRLLSEKDETNTEWRQWLVSKLLEHGAGWPMFYVAPNVPDRKMRHASAATSVGNDEEILAVLDSTGLGSPRTASCSHRPPPSATTPVRTGRPGMKSWWTRRSIRRVGTSRRTVQ